MDQLDQYLTTAIQLPIVGVFVWVVFKFMAVMKEEREAFTNALDRERESRDSSAKQLDTTLVGLTGSMQDLGHAVTELRTDVRGRG